MKAGLADNHPVEPTAEVGSITIARSEVESDSQRVMPLVQFVIQKRAKLAGSRCNMSDSNPSPKKKLYIETVGCQMNVLDSELVVGKLRSEGYELTADIEQADTILYNTCSVRQHAEDKIYSALAEFVSSRNANQTYPSACLAAWLRKTRG